jgi:hypothetical protein
MAEIWQAERGRKIFGENSTVGLGTFVKNRCLSSKERAENAGGPKDGTGLES